MKSNSMLSKLCVAVCAVALMSLEAAQSATVFPIVTNNADTCASFATDGTNYLVGIQGDYVGPNSYQITAQMFGPTGTLIGSRISPVPGHTGGNPAIACSGTDYLMVWPDDYLNGNESSISAQLLGLSGSLIGGMIAVTTNSEQKNPHVAYGDGNYLVTWDDYSNGTNWAICGQFISSSGAMVGSQLLICAPVNSQDEKGASLAFDGTNFLAVWQFNSTSGGNHNVTYGMFISPSGTMGAPFAIGQTVSLDRNPLTVLFNGTNYFVVWNYASQTDSQGNPVWNVYGRFVTPAGNFVGNEFAILTNGNPVFPIPAFDGSDYLLSWNQNLGATNSDAFFQFLNASGQPIGCQFTPFTAQGSEAPLFAPLLFDGKRFIAISTLSAGGFTPPAYSAGAYGTFIPASGTPPQFGAGAACSNSQFTLSLAGTPGINYAVQMATNLASPNWISLATNSPTNGTFTFTDTGATNGSRFYRAVKQ